MRNLRRGFTLLELMIAISLMLIIMLMLRSMFVNAQTMYLRAAKRVDVYSQSRAALDMIEQDLMRIETGLEDYHTVNCRSLMPEDLRNFEAIPESRAYSRLDDWAGAQDSQTLQIREFLSFTGRNTWYDTDKKKYVTGTAFVAYYLRRRLPDKNGKHYGGAYLVRRIIPQRSLAEIVAIGKGKRKADPIYPHEDELASFVYGVRVFVDDQAAFQLGVRNSQFNYNLMPECTPTDANAGWMWAKGTPGVVKPVPAGGGAALILQRPLRDNRVEFGGDWITATNPDRDFVGATRWNYPNVVMIDLMMIDRTFERTSEFSGNGTYRSFSRAVQLPISGPMFRLDDRDLALLTK
ncbi:MAG: prepilin-type N-terminal cleavage/methylation domain-containing protein [Planctomycetes bacterium]|nr:prepilin-type N-terminal cleavage/methylation domain-containing protein [Planctomycetota bacterium]MCB9935140.1 prepilin-type N-terminal cleavage/methylation domain-containing protein [Planctomycetota bacterium]